MGAEERQIIVYLPRLSGRGGSGFLEVAHKEKPGECARVMFPGLCGESKEDEEDERANDAGPPGEGVPGHKEMVRPPHHCRNLSDTAEIVMSFLPADPGHDRGGGRV